jgi:imidazole glycerol phosphate synthase glutamine amidotransferase subunit
MGALDRQADRLDPAVRVALIDHGAGNLVSISQGLERVGAVVTIATSPDGLSGADLVVMPGVGAAAPAMARLAERGLVAPVQAWIRADRPFLGVCLGLQLLFDGSDEDGAVTLGVFPGRTVALVDPPTTPHIGWNQVDRRRDHPLLDGIEDGADLYFVHSFAGRPEPRAEDLVVAETTHGGSFASVVAHGRCAGVQFHPERSGRDGLRILANAVSLAQVAAPARGAA